MQISIKEIQKQWGIARSTVYKHIKAGRLSRLDNGLIDVAEIIRVYGEPSTNTHKDARYEAIDKTSERQFLLDKIALLESQLKQSAQNEQWLKSQVEKAQETIKLLEHKQPSPQQSKKGLFGRLLGAINND